MACNLCNSCGNVQGITFPDFVAHSCCNPCCCGNVAGNSTNSCGCNSCNSCNSCGNVAGSSCGCGCGCNSWLPGCNARTYD